MAGKKVLAVVLDAPDDKVVERIHKEYANVYRYTDTFFLVPVESNITTRDVAMATGIKGPNRDATGVVFKLNAAYSGYTKRSLWEWLSDVEGS